MHGIHPVPYWDRLGVGHPGGYMRGTTVSTSGAACVGRSPPLLDVAGCHARCARYFKDWSPEQRLLRLSIGDRVYDVTTNNRPLVGTALIVSRFCSTGEGVRHHPQVMTEPLLADMLELQSRSTLQLLFNGWDAGASVNQFHMQASPAPLPHGAGYVVQRHYTRLLCWRSRGRNPAETAIQSPPLPHPQTSPCPVSYKDQAA